MYRLLPLSVIALAFACAKTSDTETTSKDTGQVATPAGTLTGTTEVSAPVVSGTGTFIGIARPGAAGEVRTNQPATTTAAVIPGTANPNRVPNEMGRIMVLEYHIIGDKDSQYGRERGHFRRDLELLYARGFRPVTMNQVQDKKINLAKGLSPVVMVFDDASPGQFGYIDRNGKLEVDQRTGMGIWLDFQKTHKEWGNTAVFCLLSGASSGHNFFGDKGIGGQKTEWRFPKVKWLADNGFELCNHTLWHAQLSKFPDAFVQQQIAQLQLAVDSAVPGYRIRSMALPQGLWPKNRALASRGSWTNPKDGKTTSYNYEVIFEVAGGPMRSPYDPAFNGLSTPRVQVIGNVIEQTIDKLEKAGNLYISDGNPSSVAKPAAVAAR